MTATETIREAARLMRERAEAATPGPWEHGGNDGLVWPPRIGDPVSGSTETEDADHIAFWHPTVALTVAEWLEDVADGNGVDPHALDVARAYLGGAS